MYTSLSTRILYLPGSKIRFEIKSKMLKNSPHSLKEQFLQFEFFCYNIFETLFLILPVP